MISNNEHKSQLTDMAGHLSRDIKRWNEKKVMDKLKTVHDIDMIFHYVI